MLAVTTCSLLHYYATSNSAIISSLFLLSLHFFLSIITTLPHYLHRSIIVSLSLLKPCACFGLQANLAPLTAPNMFIQDLILTDFPRHRFASSNIAFIFASRRHQSFVGLLATTSNFSARFQRTIILSHGLYCSGAVFIVSSLQRSAQRQTEYKFAWTRQFAVRSSVRSSVRRLRASNQAGKCDVIYGPIFANLKHSFLFSIPDMELVQVTL